MTDDELCREAQRLAALHEFNILDTPPDGAFDRITALAARYFNAPISLVSLVDEDRIWFKSSHGLDVDEIERTPGLCASVIVSDDAYVVENAIEDPRTLSNPLVAGDLGLRFYAAAPLVTSEGYRLGTINVCDFEPRAFVDEQKNSLHHFAKIVIDQMELRLSSRKVISQLCNMIRDSNDLDDPITVCAWTKRINIDGQWFSFEEFLSDRLGVSLTHGMHPDVADELRKKSDHDS